MRHTRREVIDRTRREFARLNRVISQLRPAEWKRSVPCPLARDPWTVREFFGRREPSREWPLDFDGHSAAHRVKDIEAALGDVARRPAHPSKSRSTRRETTNQR